MSESPNRPAQSAPSTGDSLSLPAKEPLHNALRAEGTKVATPFDPDEPSLSASWPTVAPRLAETLVLGGSMEAAGEELGLSDEEVRQVIASPEFEGVLVKALPEEQNIRERFVELASPSLDVLQGIISDKDAAAELRFKAAKDLLDRAGYTAARKVMVLSHKLSKQDVQWMREVANE